MHRTLRFLREQSKIGTWEYPVTTNSSPLNALSLNDAPVKTVDGHIIYMRDVAHVRDGWAVQQNVSRANEKPNVLLTVMKIGSVSTLDIVNQIKQDILPTLRAAAPKGLKITELFDQSLFVRAAIRGVLQEGITAASLTALMILLFLGSWRQHGYYRHLDPTLDPQFNDRLERPGTDDEHDDLRWTSPGHRYSGRRRNGND